MFHPGSRHCLNAIKFLELASNDRPESSYCLSASSGAKTAQERGNRKDERNQRQRRARNCRKNKALARAEAHHGIQTVDGYGPEANGQSQTMHRRSPEKGATP